MVVLKRGIFPYIKYSCILKMLLMCVNTRKMVWFEIMGCFLQNSMYMYVSSDFFWCCLQGCAAQEPILYSARAMLDSSSLLLKTARSLVINPKDPPTWSILAGHSRTVSDSIKSLITSIR